jgi:hypothetical protein
MAMKTATELDRSIEMHAFFQTVVRLLVAHHETPPDMAKALVNVYFSLDVHPLERALVMHRPPEQVAEELARMSRE